MTSPRGQWRTREKMEKTGCKIICGAPTTLAVKELMMMMVVVMTMMIIMMMMIMLMTSVGGAF